MKDSRLLSMVCACILCSYAHLVSAATVTIYNDRSDFLNAVGSTVYDDYSALGYRSGDINDFDGNDRHSDEHMSSIIGETYYTTTSFVDANYIFQLESNFGYCAGCNGSFLLDFTSTSVTGVNGVYGVGFGILRNYRASGDVLSWLLEEGNRSYTAYVTFGDGATANLNPTQTYTVDNNGYLQDGYNFWGITSHQEIASIHIGSIDGADAHERVFRLGDITIASLVPIPPALWLFGSGLLGLIGVARKKTA